MNVNWNSCYPKLTLLGTFLLTIGIFRYHINMNKKVVGAIEPLNITSNDNPPPRSKATTYRLTTKGDTQIQNVHQLFNITKTKEELHQLCPNNTNIDTLVDSYVAEEHTVVHDNVLLIVASLFEDYQDVFRIHNILYRKIFPKMVFCGPTKKSSLDRSYPFVYFKEVTRDKELFYMCVNDAMKKYSDPSIEGYLLLSDDLLFFYWNVVYTKENIDKVWLKSARLNTFDLITNCHTEGGLQKPINCAIPSWTPLMPKRQDRNWAKTALTQLRDSNHSAVSNCFKTLAEKNGGEFRVNYDWFMGDMFYIPASVRNEYLQISEPFIKNNLIHALAVPTIANCLEVNHGIYYLPGINDLKTRPALKSDPIWVINHAIKDQKPFVHPVKFSGIVNGKKPDRDYFCDTLLPLFYSAKLPL